jgi:hypothetical protein
MDTQIVEVRKNVIVSTTFNTVSTFTATINNVEFIPDEVIIRGINYSPAINEVGITQLYTDMVSDVIGTFFQNFYIKPDLTFTLRKPIAGLYTFTIRTVAGNAYAGRNGDIAIHLEFVKYGPEKKIF